MVHCFRRCRMHSVLVIDKSQLMIDYLSDVLLRYSFEILSATTAEKGIELIRSNRPSLVITDYKLPDLAGVKLLELIDELASLYKIPVILLSSQVDMGLLVNIARYKQRYTSLKRFMTKPVKVDSLLFTISKLLRIKIAIDKTPCKLDVNLNDDMIFVDLSHGFNSDKIKLLKYKLLELKEIYDVTEPRILVIMYDLNLDRNNMVKFDLFFDILLSFVIENYPEMKQPARGISILSMVQEVRQFVKNHPVYRTISVAGNLDEAIESFTSEEKKEKSEPAVEEKKLEYFTSLLSAPETSDQLNIHYDHSSVSRKRSCTISIVDHDIDVQNKLEARLTQIGYKVRLYSDGSTFLKRVQADMPDILLVSMDLEDVTSHDMLQALYDRKLLSRMSTIALSTVLDEMVLNDVKSFGIDTFLQLPFEDEDDFDFFQELIGMIDSFERKQEENASSRIMEDGVVIAIVDDDKTIREYMKMLFSKYNLKIKLFVDGREFIESLNESIPNLLFLDLMMPRMNGLQVLSWLEKKGYDFPVVVFSALSKTETVKKALDFGIRSYLLKPPSHVNVIINKTLEILGSQF
jgi:DNA-binding NtrC family response regulator